MSERILVVDDEAGVRDALTLLLEEAGHQPIAAPGAEAALALLEREEVALQPQLPASAAGEPADSIGSTRTRSPVAICRR